eukprot:TRINITY_DN16575_c0_g1_i1.p1 TRINITY_DN16575_c0_g1~~TRINITY_DN16575_c0_g1_i1.p1  ORF type:complete len:440 (+),score=110.38 TRINITY_DN16575_c0_g1_i1:81-1400(+)
MSPPAVEAPAAKKPRLDDHPSSLWQDGEVEAWAVKTGERAMGIRNPIREIMDTIAGKGNKEKRMISLAQGDPTCYAHLRPSDVMVNAVSKAVQSGEANGYQPSQGHGGCRSAVAEAFNVPSRPALAANDVFMTLGCSEALSHCIAALGKSGSNMLLPRPGFPLYQVLCEYHGVEARYYDLLPDQGWEVDVRHVSKLIDERTSAIVLNNPSNPCGTVYSRSHLEKVLAVAEAKKVPVIADEVYTQMSFGEKYVACAEVSPRVPVLSVCALSKRWLAPGWRLGWITVHDAEGVFKASGIPEALLKVCQVSLGPPGPFQAALPAILRETKPEWYTRVLEDLQKSAECCVRRCKTCPGLEVASEPQGAMYMMVRLVPGGLQGIDDAVTFAGSLLEEESVAVLPGECFHRYPGYFRIVFAAHHGALEEAWDRIEAFCRRRLPQK